MIEKYERMTVAELKQKAKEFGLKNISGMKKQELIELLAKIEEKVGKGKKEQNEEKKHSSHVHNHEHEAEADASQKNHSTHDTEQLDSGETKEGILEVLADGYGFIRCDNFLPGENDVYVSPAQIRRFNLKTGDIIVGNTKVKNQNEKFSALLYVKSVNGFQKLPRGRNLRI